VRVLSVARDLQRRHARERQKLFVAEGVRVVDELLRSPLVIRGALSALTGAADGRAMALVNTLRERGIPVQEVSAAEFGSAADTDTPQGLLAVAEIPQHTLSSLSIDARSRLVILDAVQDPGNVGTIIRTADALGAVATVALPGTVDLWNAKVVRSSMGAHFHHPAFASTWGELTTFLADREIALWGADMAGEPLDTVVRDRGGIPSPLALVVGNEGGGLSAEARKRAGKLVALPIAAVESLNVAVATGIILYELRR
jgi:TrmH family RNA methyltransferase